MPLNLPYLQTPPTIYLLSVFYIIYSLYSLKSLHVTSSVLGFCGLHLSLSLSLSIFACCFPCYLQFPHFQILFHSLVLYSPPFFFFTLAFFLLLNGTLVLFSLTLPRMFIFHSPSCFYSPCSTHVSSSLPPPSFFICVVCTLATSLIVTLCFTITVFPLFSVFFVGPLHFLSFSFIVYLISLHYLLHLLFLQYMAFLR